MTLPFHVLLQTRAAKYVAEFVLTSDAAKNQVNIFYVIVVSLILKVLALKIWNMK